MINMILIHCLQLCNFHASTLDLCEPISLRVCLIYRADSSALASLFPSALVISYHRLQLHILHTRTVEWHVSVCRSWRSSRTWSGARRTTWWGGRRSCRPHSSSWRNCSASGRSSTRYPPAGRRWKTETWLWLCVYVCAPVWRPQNYVHEWSEERDKKKGFLTCGHLLFSTSGYQQHSTSVT